MRGKKSEILKAKHVILLPFGNIPSQYNGEGTILSPLITTETYNLSPCVQQLSPAVAMTGNTITSTEDIQFSKLLNKRENFNVWFSIDF